MEQPLITFILNGKTYSLRAGDTAAIGAIPQPERQQLIALLEAVKQQEIRAREVVQSALDKAGANRRDPQGPAAVGDGAIKPDRLGSGDVDALMARLVMEENRSRKPGPTKHQLYKWVLGSAALIILLIIFLS